jgi:hypothetical protein
MASLADALVVEVLNGRYVAALASRHTKEQASLPG